MAERSEAKSAEQSLASKNMKISLRSAIFREIQFCELYGFPLFKLVFSYRLLWSVLLENVSILLNIVISICGGLNRMFRNVNAYFRCQEKLQKNIGFLVFGPETHEHDQRVLRSASHRLPDPENNGFVPIEFANNIL